MTNRARATRREFVQLASLGVATTAAFTGELALLNGPQLAGAAMAQDDIDRLLSGGP